MPGRKLLIGALLIALLILLAAIYGMCRSGTRPPAERAPLEETALTAVPSVPSQQVAVRL